MLSEGVNSFAKIVVVQLEQIALDSLVISINNINQ